MSFTVFVPIWLVLLLASLLVLTVYCFIGMFLLSMKQSDFSDLGEKLSLLIVAEKHFNSGNREEAERFGEYVKNLDNFKNKKSGLSNLPAALLFPLMIIGVVITFIVVAVLPLLRWPWLLMEINEDLKIRKTDYIRYKRFIDTLVK